MMYQVKIGPFSKTRGVLNLAHPSGFNCGINDGFRGVEMGLNLIKPQFSVRKINFSEFKYGVFGQSWYWTLLTIHLKEKNPKI